MRLLNQAQTPEAILLSSAIVMRGCAQARATGEKVEGRKSHAEAHPEVAKLAKALARKKPEGWGFELGEGEGEGEEAINRLITTTAWPLDGARCSVQP
jgi:hypothetical protein